MRACIINYNCGNIVSLKNALEHLGTKVVVTNDAEEINSSDRIFVPGVGAFGYAIQNFDQYQLRKKLGEAVLDKKIPTLGICLGAQIMLESSEESAEAKGLGWIKGSVDRIRPSEKSERVPHVGWNHTDFKKNSIFSDNGTREIYYYTHSYFMNLGDTEDIVADCSFGGGFSSVFQRNNIFGCQFHPEKSQKSGLAFLSHFLKM